MLVTLVYDIALNDSVEKWLQLRDIEHFTTRTLFGKRTSYTAFWQTDVGIYQVNYKSHLRFFDSTLVNIEWTVKYFD